MQAQTVIKEIHDLAATLDIEDRMLLIREIAALPMTKQASLASNDNATSTVDADEMAYDQQLRAEQEAWYGASNDAQQKYAGMYVAIRNGEVVDHDSEPYDLLIRVRAEYKNEPIPVIPAESTEVPEYRVHGASVLK